MRKNSIAKAIAAAVMLGALAAQPVVCAAQQGGEDAVLNFVGADIESVIKAVGHFTGTTFIVDPRVKGTLTLVSEKRVTKQQAFNLLASALRLQGYAVVATNGITKVVPEADAKLQAAPVQTGAKGDQIVSQIFRLNYESAANMAAVLRPLISPNNTINAIPGNNSLVITDYADNMTRLGKIIAALDAPASSDLDVVPIRHAIASDIATMVNRLMEGSGPEARTTLLADSRTNSVIVRAPSAARANLARSLIAKLDQPTALPGNVHVVYLKNADAVKLAQTLRAVVAMDAALPSTAAPAALSTPAASGTGMASGATQPATAPGATSAPGLTSGGAGGFIQADPSTNTLIITASEPVYRNLRAVIDQLDARRAQVYVESLIVEVTADKAAELGIQWAGISGNDTSDYRVGGLTSFSTGGNNLVNLAVGAGTVPPGRGLSIGVFKQNNGKLSLGAVAHALESGGGTNILSMPNLITLDNEEARIIVGRNVPFITGQYSSTSAGTNTVNPFQTIERKDVGLSLRVRPQISEGGSVKMAVYQETSAVQDTTNPAGIITSKRSIETNVLVDDGQIIVLGGLIEDSVDESQEKVPGLGDVPVLGNLFKYRTRKHGKTNLMVFLRPTVLRSAEQSVNVTSDRYDYIRSAESARPAGAPLMADVPPPMLPALQNGKPASGTLLKPDSSNLGTPAPRN